MAEPVPADMSAQVKGGMGKAGSVVDIPVGLGGKGAFSFGSSALV